MLKKLFDSTKGKGKNKPNSKIKDTSPSFIETLFSLDVLLDLIVFCLYIAYFSIKVKNLYNDVETFENTEPDTKGKEDIQIREYYPIAMEHLKKITKQKSNVGTSPRQISGKGKTKISKSM